MCKEWPRASWYGGDRETGRQGVVGEENEVGQVDQGASVDSAMKVSLYSLHMSRV